MTTVQAAFELSTTEVLEWFQNVQSRKTSRKKPAKNIWLNIEKRTLNECWNWKGSRSAQGYGYCYSAVNGERLAHRRVWIERNGPIPEGKIIMHLCNNPSCCNPSHLYCGTHQENMNHKVLSGHAIGGRKFTLLSADSINQMLASI